ncbi:hypothetical protein NUSPORA_02081 [Nucleospora cyclopteri]
MSVGKEIWTYLTFIALLKTRLIIYDADGTKILCEVVIFSIFHKQNFPPLST